MAAGKRRDQTTSELFGSHDEKDLRACPKTFVPREDYLTAKQKKLLNLRSEVLPCSDWPAGILPTHGEPAQRRPNRPEALEEDAGAVDAMAWKQQDLSSGLFGRATPEVSTLHQPKLTPNDFQWHSLPEATHSPAAAEAMSHAERAYKQKCSALFEHESPQVLESLHEESRKAKQEEQEAKERRRGNAYYSDLFGRSTPMEQRVDSVRPGRAHGTVEDRIVLHQDWTDSKTEFLANRAARPEDPSLRKHYELDQGARIFGQQEDDWQPRAERPEPVDHDNSGKVKGLEGKTNMQIHQAHLRTSITPAEFYDAAHSSKDWEVVELHLGGLPRTADDAYIKDLCQGFDLHIVKAKADTDPVSNLCKGRGKVMVRYNPTRISVVGLVQQLEEKGLRVEM